MCKNRGFRCGCPLKVSSATEKMKKCAKTQISGEGVFVSSICYIHSVKKQRPDLINSLNSLNSLKKKYRPYLQFKEFKEFKPFKFLKFFKKEIRALFPI